MESATYQTLAEESLSHPYIPSRMRKIVVLIVCFLQIMISGGISHSYGVVMVVYIDEFNISTSEAAWAAGIEQFFFYITGRR